MSAERVSCHAKEGSIFIPLVSINVYRYDVKLRCETCLVSMGDLCLVITASTVGAPTGTTVFNILHPIHGLLSFYMYPGEYDIID